MKILNDRLNLSIIFQFQYKNETNFSLGSIGIEEVDCDTIDLSYVSPSFKIYLMFNSPFPLIF